VVKNQSMIETNKLLLENALINIDYVAARKVFHDLRADYTSIDIIERVLTPVLENIGAGWEEGSVSLSQVYMSGCMCEELMDEILPISEINVTPSLPIALATLNDYHLLGARIVYSILRSSGIAITNYGRMDIESLVGKAMDDGIKVLLVSVLMVPSALSVKQLRERFIDEGYEIKIVVGGAPFRLDASLWTEVGADAMGSSASDAVRIVRRLIREI
jgi:methanogenic corrinoid protein MtbC1